MPEDLNRCYNIDYNQKMFPETRRKNVEITFDPHVFTRQLERNFSLDFVEETVREGDIEESRSELPHKLCFKRYNGKEKKTYYVITKIHREFIEVKTVWLQPGK